MQKIYALGSLHKTVCRGTLSVLINRDKVSCGFVIVLQHPKHYTVNDTEILGPFTISDLVAPASNIPSTSRDIESCKWFLENGKCSRRCRTITAQQLVLLLTACTESLS